MPLITRSGKNSKLTAAEMDGNLTYLESLALIGASSSADISAVNAGTGLTGGGSTGNVTLSLDIPSEYITEDMLNIVGGPTAGYILSNDGTNLTWIEANPGDITGVIAGTGLTGGGLSGDVTLNIDDTYVSLKSDLSSYLATSGGTISGTVSFDTGVNLIGSFVDGPITFENEIRLSGPTDPAFLSPFSGLQLISKSPTFGLWANLTGKLHVGPDMIQSSIKDSLLPGQPRAISALTSTQFISAVYDFEQTSQVGIQGYNGVITLRANSATSSYVPGVSLSTDLLTSARTINFPDASGTLSLTSDLASYLSTSGGTISGSVSFDNNVYLTGQSSDGVFINNNSISLSLNPVSQFDNGIVLTSVNQSPAGSGFFTKSVVRSGSFNVISTMDNLTSYSSIDAGGVGASINYYGSTWSSNFMVGSGAFVHAGVNSGSNSSNYALFDTNALASNKIFNFPDASGTLPVYSGSSAPVTSGSAGKKGDITSDSSYLYVCIADNTWIRSSITTSW